MIYSKSNLQVVEMTSKDKDINILSHVHFNKEGYTAAVDGKAMLIVEPSPEEYTKNFVIKSIDNGDCNLPATGVKEVLKNLPNDSKFKGLLEQMAITSENESSVEITTTDGQQIKKVQVRKHRKNFPEIKNTLKDLLSRKIQAHICLNRSRLIRLLQAIDRACPDSSHENPVYLTVTQEEDIILKARNMKTGQTVFGIMTSYEENYLKKSKWEKELLE